MMALPSHRHQLMIARYAAGLTLREVAAEFSVTMQAVHQAVTKHAASLLRPAHIVPPRRRRPAEKPA